MTDKPQNEEEVDVFKELITMFKPHGKEILDNFSNGGAQKHARWKIEFLTKMGFIFFLTIAVFCFSKYLIDLGRVDIGIGILTHAIAILVGAVLSAFSVGKK